VILVQLPGVVAAVRVGSPTCEREFVSVGGSEPRAGAVPRDATSLPGSLPSIAPFLSVGPFSRDQIHEVHRDACRIGVDFGVFEDAIARRVVEAQSGRTTAVKALEINLDGIRFSTTRAMSLGRAGIEVTRASLADLFRYRLLVALSSFAGPITAVCPDARIALSNGASEPTAQIGAGGTPINGAIAVPRVSLGPDARRRLALLNRAGGHCSLGCGVPGILAPQLGRPQSLI
jgi:hypothetical protein